MPTIKVAREKERIFILNDFASAKEAIVKGAWKSSGKKSNIFSVTGKSL